MELDLAELCKKEIMRVIIEPIALNWKDASAFAKYRGGPQP